MWLALLLGIAALAFAGCGDDDDGGGGGGEAASEEAPSATEAPPGTPPSSRRRAAGRRSRSPCSPSARARSAFDNQNMAGAVSAMAQFAGAKPKNPDKPRDGWTGAINGHPLELVGVGCGDDLGARPSRRRGG